MHPTDSRPQFSLLGEGGGLKPWFRASPGEPGNPPRYTEYMLSKLRHFFILGGKLTDCLHNGATRLMEDQWWIRVLDAGCAVLSACLGETGRNRTPPTRDVAAQPSTTSGQAHEHSKLWLWSIIATHREPLKMALLTRHMAASAGPVEKTQVLRNT